MHVLSQMQEKQLLKGGEKMKKQSFSKPIIMQGKEKVQPIICKRAACSGGSSHLATKYKYTTVVKSQKIA